MKNNFNLTRPLCFLDLEATGLHIIRDRIVQIGIIKFSPGVEESEELDMLINPGVPISQEAYEVHGISAQDVASAPTFAQAASRVNAFIEGCDLAGYNSHRFDLPMLMEEMDRAGYDLDLESRSLIDVQTIFHKMEPRTLAAAHRFYCGTEMENAHDALADVEATAAVLMGQLKMYKESDYVDRDGNVTQQPIRNDVKALHDFTNDSKIIDVTKKVKYNDKGEVVFNFGKYRGRKVGETLQRDKQYYQWILAKEFSVQVKRIVREEYEKAGREN